MLVGMFQQRITSKTMWQHIHSWCLGICVALLCVFISAQPALARAKSRFYTIPKVHIEALVLPDGTLQVEEYRTFDFRGSFNGVYWYFPLIEREGMSEPRSIKVDSVSLVDETHQQEELFSENLTATVGSSKAYSVKNDNGKTKVTVFHPSNSEERVFKLSYHIPSLVQRHADVAELYWMFIPEGWEQDSENITCVLRLPIPESENFVLGDTVRAWGHGNLAGIVEQKEREIHFSVPHISAGDFAEMRVVFPQQWLTDAPSSSQQRLQTILAEEQKWADDANATRMNSMIVSGSLIVLLFVGIAGIVMVTRRIRSYRKQAIKLDYFSQIPSRDHPAIMATMFQDTWNVAPERLFLASLMRLSVRGILKLELDHHSYKNLLKPKAKDYTITWVKPLPPVVSNNHKEKTAFEIDSLILEIIFRTADYDLAEYKSVRKSEFSERFTHSTEIAAADEQLSRLSSICLASIEKEYRVCDSRHTKSMVFHLITAILQLILTFVITTVAFNVLTAVSVFMVIMFGVVNFVVAVVYIMLSISMKDTYTVEGYNVLYRIKGFAHWCDSTKEIRNARIEDTLLWKEILVVACALGVTKKLLKYLEEFYPDLIEDEQNVDLFYAMQWMYLVNSSSSRGFAPDSILPSSSSFESGLSNWSGGGGGGGGFSSGGGGGFGSGGGGGAF